MQKNLVEDIWPKSPPDANTVNNLHTQNPQIELYLKKHCQTNTASQLHLFASCLQSYKFEICGQFNLLNISCSSQHINECFDESWIVTICLQHNYHRWCKILRAHCTGQIQLSHHKKFYSESFVDSIYVYQ